MFLSIDIITHTHFIFHTKDIDQIVDYCSIVLQMEHSFFVLKILHESNFMLR